MIDCNVIISAGLTVNGICQQAILIYMHAAINSGSKYLITGNIKDFPELIYKQVNILLPKDFLLGIKYMSRKHIEVLHE